MKKIIRSTAQVKKDILALSQIADVKELKKTPEAREIFEELLEHLNHGTIRSAEPQANGSWVINGWVREGIVKVGFRLGKVTVFSSKNDGLKFSDKDTLPLQDYK